jgi:uncharacterized membrane protein
MLSSHFPSLYAHDRSDLALFTLVASGAAVRHWLNIRFTFQKWKIALAGTIAATLLLLAAQLGVRPFQMRTHAAGTGAGVAELDSLMAALPGNIPFVEARRVLDRRCTACHSATPSDVSLGVMPGGVAFDTPEQIQAFVARIRERAIVTRTMPPANKTMLTERERAILAKWIAEGGRTR